MLHHEILFALLGHPGSLFSPPTPSSKSDPDLAYRCTPLLRSLLTPSEITHLERTISHAHLIPPLQNFADAAADADAGESLYLRAVRRGVERMMDEYNDRVRDLERDVLTTGSGGAGVIATAMRREVEWVTSLSRFVGVIETMS
eukprot:CAMPEP_0172498172 /NCGR_PEP_ID=MMETSP1066-20121228/110372_1 /TAXON_ID=671091 /ORGANISM="Coscinodiscus wailesii, Strain CCMP2513" /LENGTH=143 /DNA_ID=CAMNT_0013271355 /DNA_START=218 /DNA_END=646 /DNA_ORIENTATION=+